MKNLSAIDEAKDLVTKEYIDNHTGNTTVHITAAERTAWNAKWDYNADTIKGVKVNNAGYADSAGTATDNTKLPLSGGTITGDLSVNNTTTFGGVHKDSYYASNVCRFFYGGTPTQYVIWSRINYESGTHMPLVRIYGYAYGLQSPIEVKVGFYIYDGALGWCGSVSQGAWNPDVYLWKYRHSDGKDYVAIGLNGACYFCGFQVDVQVGALGSISDNSIRVDGWTTSHNGADTSVTLIPDVGTDNCASVPYQPIATSISGNATTATTATTLANSRTIWGQSFNGSGNVSGALSGATTGSFSSNVTVGGTLVSNGNIGINQANGTGVGISLYNGTSYVWCYGLAFATTGNKGKWGTVTGDWATYFTMDGAKERGWLFKHYDGTFAASLSAAGNFQTLGSVTSNGLTVTNGTKSVSVSVDSDGNLKFDGNIYATGFVSAGGQSTTGGGGSTDLSSVWDSLKNNTDSYANEKINIAHIPSLTISKISDIANASVSYATSAGSANSASVAYKLWTTSHPDDWYQRSYWDGSYFWLTARNSSESELPNAVAYATTAGSATDSTKVPLAGGAMTGALTWGGNYVSVNWRTGHASYNSKVEYMTAGNEALVFANQNSVTSFMFYTGLDLENRYDWNGCGTPAMQIKQNCVYINELINDGVAPSYNLKVNGSFYATSGSINGNAIYHEGNLPAYPTKASWNYDDVYVKLTDSRLTDARNAADVYSWAKAATKPSYTYSEVGAAASGHTHSVLNTAFTFNNSDIPEEAANLASAAAQHSIQFYRNGFLIPYQMDNANDGGMFRVRGTSEDSCIAEIATWDDSGAGETIQFNYYPTTSQVTPTYSVSVPKKSGTIALTSDIPTSLPASDVYSWAKASTKPSYDYTEITNLGSASVSYASTSSYATRLSYSGMDSNCFTVAQTSSNFKGKEGWASYLICNHGDGNTYYNQIIRMPFESAPEYARAVGNGADTWYSFITSENIASQSVNYATSAGGLKTKSWSAYNTDGGSFTGYKKLTSITYGIWIIAKATFNVYSRHGGTLRYSFEFRSSDSIASYDCKISANGVVTEGYNIRFFYNSSTGVLTAWKYFYDYDTTNITQELDDDFTFNGDNTEYSAIPDDVGTEISVLVNTATNLSGGSVSATSGSFSGDVGIGTTSPQAKLQVEGAIAVSGTTVLCWSSNNWSPAVSEPQWYGITKYDAHSSGGWGTRIANYFGFEYAVGSGFGHNFYGTIICDSEITAHSDRRLKSNIQDLEFRGKLAPKTFIKDDKECIGFIAQDVRELYPELVHGEETDKKYLSLNYGAITAVLAAQLNNTDDEVATLKKKVAELETEIAELRRMA